MDAEITWAIQYLEERVNALFDECGRDDPETKNLQRMENLLKRIERSHSYSFEDTQKETS